MSKLIQRLQIITRRSGSAYGSGASSTARTTVKMAEVAPMPSARVTRAAVANPGVRSKPAQPHRDVLPDAAQSHRVYLAPLDVRRGPGLSTGYPNSG